MINAPHLELDELIFQMGSAGKRLSEIDACEGAAGNISLCIRGPVDPSDRFPLVDEIKLPQPVPELGEKEKVQVLIGGTCSSMNTEDKLFPDGKDTFLKWLDFTSIHYQPMDTLPTLIPAWTERQSPFGPCVRRGPGQGYHRPTPQGRHAEQCRNSQSLRQCHESRITQQQ